MPEIYTGAISSRKWLPTLPAPRDSDDVVCRWALHYLGRLVFLEAWKAVPVRTCPFPGSLLLTCIAVGYELYRSVGFPLIYALSSRFPDS